MTAPKLAIGKDSQDGFTLLEILVSLAVMAIVLVSVFRLHSSTLNLADATRSQSLLPFIARRQLADVLSRSPMEGTVSGDVEEDGTVYHWSCTIEERSFEDPIAVSKDQARRFKAIKLTVTQKQENRTFSLTTWRYQGDAEE